MKDTYFSSWQERASREPPVQDCDAGRARDVVHYRAHSSTGREQIESHAPSTNPLVHSPSISGTPVPLSGKWCTHGHPRRQRWTVWLTVRQGFSKGTGSTHLARRALSVQKHVLATRAAHHDTLAAQTVVVSGNAPAGRSTKAAQGPCGNAAAAVSTHRLHLCSVAAQLKPMAGVAHLRR